ncbi:MAG: excalibur calcium-binding domain-containing protein [Cellulomonadaceae bacterium]|jgi:hypothetical protein|nr:excalibur calcium-binding domain-containing protein [Cellulomonadaceae bacterium]
MTSAAWRTAATSALSIGLVLSGLGVAQALPAQAHPRSSRVDIPVCWDEDKGNYIFRSANGDFYFKDESGNIVDRDEISTDIDREITVVDNEHPQYGPVSDDVTEFLQIENLVPGDCGMGVIKVTNGSAKAGHLRSYLLAVELLGDPNRDFYDEFSLAAEGLPLTPVSQLTTSVIGVRTQLEQTCISAGQTIGVPIIFDFPFEAIGGNTLKHGDHQVKISLQFEFEPDVKSCPGSRPDVSPSPPVTPSRSPSIPSEPSYPNCEAVWTALGRPLLRGQPGYNFQLDTDGDGVACAVAPPGYTPPPGEPGTDWVYPDGTTPTPTSSPTPSPSGSGTPSPSPSPSPSDQQRINVQPRCPYNKQLLKSDALCVDPFGGAGGGEDDPGKAGLYTTGPQEPGQGGKGLSRVATGPLGKLFRTGVGTMATFFGVWLLMLGLFLVETRREQTKTLTLWQVVDAATLPGGDWRLDAAVARRSGSAARFGASSARRGDSNARFGGAAIQRGGSAARFGGGARRRVRGTSELKLWQGDGFDA